MIEPGTVDITFHGKDFIMKLSKNEKLEDINIYTNSTNWIKLGELIGQNNDVKYDIPNCPMCHDEDVSAIIHNKNCDEDFFGDPTYYVLCNNCNTIGREASNHKDAIEYWTNGEIKIEREY